MPSDVSEEIVMRMRSTGLGKTELKAHISSIEKVDDSILFKVIYGWILGA